jgi:hypothetical protein
MPRGFAILVSFSGLDRTGSLGAARARADPHRVAVLPDKSRSRCPARSQGNAARHARASLGSRALAHWLFSGMQLASSTATQLPTPIDTTSDTTQRETRRNLWQPPAKKSALDKPILQRTATPRNRHRRNVAQEKDAGSSSVGHPRRFSLSKPNARKQRKPTVNASSAFGVQ